jgi:O-antigen/teichoic acid export membrane protein
MGGKQIKFGALLSYILILFNILAGLIYTPWMINKIGRSDYGLYVLVTTFLTYFVVDFGMWQAINKIVCSYRAENKNDSVKDVIGQAFKIYLCVDIVIIIILFIVYFKINDIFIKLTPEELIKFKNVYILAAIASVLSFPLNFIQGIMSAYEYFIQMKLFDFISKILVIALTITCLFLGLGLYSLVIAFGYIPLIIKLTEVIFLYHRNVKCNIRYHNWNLVKSIIGLSVWLFVIVLAELFINNISPSILARYSGTEEIAVFAIGLTIYSYVYSFAGALNGLFLPKISRYTAIGDKTSIESLTFKIERIQLFILGYIILAIFLTGKSFVKAWMGNNFIQSYYVAILLLLPGIIVFCQAIESTHLFAIGKIKYRSMCMFATAIISVVVSIILAPTMGAIGVAIGICVGNMIGMVVCMNIVYRKFLDFNYIRYIKTISLFVGCFVLIGIVYKSCIYTVCQHSNYEGWKMFLIQAVIYTILYPIFMWLLIIKSSEKREISNYIKSKMLRTIK